MTGEKVLLAAVLACAFTGCANPVSRDLHYSSDGRQFAYVLSKVAGADAGNWRMPSNGGHYEYVVYGYNGCPESIQRVRVVSELFSEYDYRDQINDIVFSPDGRYLAVTTNWKVCVLRFCDSKFWKVADIQRPIVAWLGKDELAWCSNPDCGIGEESTVAFRKRVELCEGKAMPIPESRRVELLRAWKLTGGSCTPRADESVSR